MSVLCLDDTIEARQMSINGSIAMHLNQIKSFITVSQVLNFTNAARQNGVPQSTISRQINDLEQQLGVKLFYRTRRDVRLTQEGRAFLPYAQEILDAAKKGAFAVRQLHEGAEGRLSIATIDDSDRFLSRCLREFSRRYPGIVVDLTYVSHGEPLQSEVDDPYDFHFHYLDMIPDSEEYEVMETHTSQLCFVSPKRGGAGVPDEAGVSGSVGRLKLVGGDGSVSEPGSAGGSGLVEGHGLSGSPELVGGDGSVGEPGSAGGSGLVEGHGAAVQPEPAESLDAAKQTETAEHLGAADKPRSTGGSGASNILHPVGEPVHSPNPASSAGIAGAAGNAVGGLDLDTLPRGKFILISEEENPILYMQVMNYCQTHRFTPQVVNRFSDVKSVLLSVGSGLGISILPSEVAAIVASLPDAGIQVTPIDDESYAITCAVAWKKSLLNPAAELFLQVMEEMLG